MHIIIYPFGNVEFDMPSICQMLLKGYDWGTFTRNHYVLYRSYTMSHHMKNDSDMTVVAIKDLSKVF